MWNDCSHEWGKQEYICIFNNQECFAGLTYDNMERDKENCIGQGCLYIKNTNWIEPECCKDSTISGSTGCACETQEQIDYIAKRGGNKSSGEY